MQPMPDVEYFPESGARRASVPRLSFPLPHRQSKTLWRKVRAELRWNDDFLSEYLGVDGDGIPFFLEEGGVRTHRVRILNGVPLLLLPVGAAHV